LGIDEYIRNRIKAFTNLRIYEFSPGKYMTNRQNFDNISLVAGYRPRSQRQNPQGPNHARVLEQRDAKAVQKQKKKK
jgi:hypothetical protein